MLGHPSCELSILLPCLNESQTLETCIRKARSFLDANGVMGEVIVADNGSTDGSQTIARQCGAHLVTIDTHGYGAALAGGIAAAGGEYVIMGDADDSYDLRNLMPFLEKLRQGFDLVMGNRFRGGIQPEAMPFLHRYLGNPGLSYLGRLFFKSQIGDFHCGLRGFRRESILSLDLRTTGMEFASEMIVKATLHNLKITEVPTCLYLDGRNRRSHLQTWSDGWRHLSFLLLFSPRWLFLYPGIILVVLGMLAYLWLLPGPRSLGSIRLDIDTLLYIALLILVGVQAIFFALLTNVFGIMEGFLPPSPSVNRLLKLITLENGFLAGFLLILSGLISSLLALHYWGILSFGNLNPSVSMRLVIPGVVLFNVGFQVILSSFFLSLLRLQRR
jgi:glycosyltransferase involved in cell wall biosynthesis